MNGVKKEFIIFGIIALVLVAIIGDHLFSSTKSQSPTSYKNGTYTGSVNNAYYGNVQARVIIQKGKITSVGYVQYPTTDPTSIYIAKDILPILKKEIIKAQSAQVSAISGATYTSEAFLKSLTAALQKS